MNRADSFVSSCGEVVLKMYLGTGIDIDCRSLLSFPRALYGVDVRFGVWKAKFGLELEGEEVGFVDFEEGVGDEAFASFDFDVIAYGALLAKNSSPDCQ